MLSSVKVSCTRWAARSSASCSSTSRSPTAWATAAKRTSRRRATSGRPRSSHWATSAAGSADQRRPSSTNRPGRLGVREAGREPGEPLVVVGERDAGRHHQVAAAQQRADVGELGGVHPPDLPVQMVGAGQHLGVGAAHGRHLQHVADRQHLDSLTGRSRKFLTERRVATAPPARQHGAMTPTDLPGTIDHWSNGAPYAGTSGRFADVTNPATGQVSGRVALASGSDAEAVIAARPGGRGGVGAHLARAAYAGAVRLPRAAELPARGARRDHHLRARQGALRRHGRDRPRPGGRGVRVRHLPPAQGRALRERLDRGRRALQARPAGRGRHHLAVQLPGHGADVVLPDRDRGRQHGRAQAEREGPVGLAVDRAAVEGRRPARRRLQRAPG